MNPAAPVTSALGILLSTSWFCLNLLILFFNLTDHFSLTNSYYNLVYMRSISKRYFRFPMLEFDPKQLLFLKRTFLDLIAPLTCLPYSLSHTDTRSRHKQSMYPALPVVSLSPIRAHTPTQQSVEEPQKIPSERENLFLR